MYSTIRLHAESLYIQSFSSPRSPPLSSLSSGYEQSSVSALTTRSRIVKCYSKCDNTDRSNVTWCVNVFDYVGGRDYEVCISANETTITPAAKELGLDEHFELPEVCCRTACRTELGCNFHCMTRWTALLMDPASSERSFPVACRLYDTLLVSSWSTNVDW